MTIRLTETGKQNGDLKYMNISKMKKKNVNLDFYAQLNGYL